MLRLFIDEMIDDNNLLYLSSFDVIKEKFLLSLFSRFSNIECIFYYSFLSCKEVLIICFSGACIGIRLFTVFVCMSFTYNVGGTDTSVLTSCVR